MESSRGLPPSILERGGLPATAGANKATLIPKGFPITWFASVLDLALQRVFFLKFGAIPFGFVFEVLLKYAAFQKSLLNVRIPTLFPPLLPNVVPLEKCMFENTGDQLAHGFDVRAQSRAGRWLERLLFVKVWPHVRPLHEYTNHLVVVVVQVAGRLRLYTVLYFTKLIDDQQQSAHAHK